MAGVPVRVGCLCTATIAKKNALAMHHADGFELKLVGSRKPSSAAEFINSLKEHGYGLSAQPVDSYYKVISSDEVDCVYIPLPAGLHREWVEKAASHGKHVLLEKPVALTSEDLDAMVLAVNKAGVQLMDGTMWMHHPRTKHMRQILADGSLGDLMHINASSSYHASQDFLAGDIRTKPELDGLGCLGDHGWYCVRAMLWAMNYTPPVKIIGSSLHKTNGSGVLISCSGSVEFPGGVVGSFDCSFDTPMRNRFEIAGTEGTLLCEDYVLPFDPEKSTFTQSSEHGLSELDLRCTNQYTEHSVTTPKSQEALMWEEMARCIRECSSTRSANESWHHSTELTQRVVLALHSSILQGGVTIDFADWVATN